MNANAGARNKAVRKGLVHLDAGRIENAERLFHSVLISEPNNPEANHALGTLAVRQGKPQSALSFLSAALQADPKQSQHWLSFAEALLKTGAIGDARAVLERAMARGFSAPEIAALQRRVDCAELYQGALEYHKAGHLGEAEKLYTAALSIDPGHVDSLNMIGRLAAQTNRAEVGLQLIREAIRLGGDVPTFYCGLGEALTGCGRHDEALQAFTRAFELQPVFPEARTSLGNLYQSLGQFDEAVRQYEAVIAGGVSTASAHNNLGAMLFERRSMDQAIAHLSEAIRQKPDFAEAHNNLGSALQESGRLDEATSHYREAIRHNPNLATARNNLANLFKAQGKIIEAIEDYWAAIRLDPKLISAYNNLIMLLGYTDVPHEELVALTRIFDAQIAAPLLRRRALPNLPDPDRRLRIGYVSGDFRDHAVHYFFEPLLQHHRKNDFEFFAYANMPMEDFSHGAVEGGV